MRRVLLAVLVLAVAAVGALAAEGGDATRPPAENKGSPSGDRSYFEGTWVGAWTGWQDASTMQNVTVKVERGAKEGFYRVEYSWGAVNFRRGMLPSGSVTAKGVEENDRLVAEWKNKKGGESRLTLEKHKDNAVKARLDKSGVLSPAERPFSETILTRK